MRTRPYLLLVGATICLGLTLDTSLPIWGQTLTNVLTFSVFAYVLIKSTAEEARILLICTVLALAGEIFLCFGWGLYTYRLGNLPWFVPPGHALLFFAGYKLSQTVPRWFPRLVTVLALLTVSTQVFAFGYTSELLWIGLYLFFHALDRERTIYSVMLVLALGLELIGTYLGAWVWAEEVRFFGLSSMNPPLMAGAFYCVLDYLVLSTDRLLPKGIFWQFRNAEEVKK